MNNITRSLPRYPWQLFLLIGAILLCLLYSQPALASDRDYQLLNNKDYTLDRTYQPDDLVPIGDILGAAPGIKLRAVAADALSQMIQDMRAAGIRDIYANSAFRTFDKQSSLYSNRVAQYRAQGYSIPAANAAAAKLIAPPGSSEHQLGLAIDFSTNSNRYKLNASFSRTRAGKWLLENAYRYGFILRYPEDKTNITHYSYEAWHYRYVGQPHAEYIYKHQLCYEEYIQKLQEDGLIAYQAADGQTYVTYYCSTAVSEQLPGEIIDRSLLFPGTQIYLVTTRQESNTLVDIYSHWGRHYIEEMQRVGLVQGYPDHTFRPNNPISKAELTTMVGRLLNLLPEENTETTQALPEFQDVTTNNYYYQALLTCYHAGLLDANLYRYDEDGLPYFHGAEIVRRQQVALMLAKLFCDTPEAQLPAQHGFTDLADQEQAVLDAVRILSNCHIIEGDNQGRFLPHSDITRAEICAIFSRILTYFQVESEEATTASHS